MTWESQSPLSFLSSPRKHFPLPHISRKSLDNLSLYAAVMSKHMRPRQNYLFQSVKAVSFLGQVSGMHQHIRGEITLLGEKEELLVKR